MQSVRERARRRQLTGTDAESPRRNRLLSAVVYKAPQTYPCRTSRDHGAPLLGACMDKTDGAPPRTTKFRSLREKKQKSLILHGL